MKVGDVVRMSSLAPTEVRVLGKIIRIGTNKRVSVMWTLKGGAVLCQSENTKNLKKITTKQKKNT